MLCTGDVWNYEIRNHVDAFFPWTMYSVEMDGSSAALSTDPGPTGTSHVIKILPRSSLLASTDSRSIMLLQMSLSKVHEILRVWEQAVLL